MALEDLQGVHGALDGVGLQGVLRVFRAGHTIEFHRMLAKVTGLVPTEIWSG